MTSQNLLQQLRDLDDSSLEYHDQLVNIVYGEEYRQCVGALQGDNLVELVDYLDKVRCRVALLRLYLSKRRPSIFSILQVTVSGNVYLNSETYAAPGRYYQPHTSSHLQSSVSKVADLLPRAVPGISSKGPSTVQVFVSNASGCMPRMTLRKLEKCAVQCHYFPLTVADKSHRSSAGRL